MLKKITKNKSLLSALVSILAILLVVNVFIMGFPSYGKASALGEDYNYYKFDYKNGDELFAEALKLNEEICQEGFTLLKNNGLLPMAPSAGQTKIKTSMFGNHSASLIYCGFGSSDNWKGTKSVYEVFDSSVFELNPKLKNLYNNNNLSGGKTSGHDSIDPYRMGLPIRETPISAYTKDITDSYKDYDELAVVFISRTAGEGSDLPTTSLNANFTERNDENKLSNARNWNDHYLQLDKNEVDMLQMVMNNFNDILVVMNGASYIELGFLDDPTHYLYTDNNYTASAEEAAAKAAKFKAAININMPGSDGILALPKIMDGTVNPSGHLSDTWVRNMKNDPTYQNSGLSGMTTSELRYGEYYVHYDEDIYMGYRYYETRYKTEGENGDEWYDNSVMFPFGHGLSYTTFDWELLSCESGEGNSLSKDGKITTKVRVTNTGSQAGKDVVQLYYNAPYTKGGISKAHVVIGGFEKTKLLAPNEHEDITIELKVSDMYSYDWSDANKNGFKGYELDGGAYNIVIAQDAHEAAKLLEDFTTIFNISDGFRYENDTTTGAEVKNRFDYASGTGKVNDPEKFKGIRKYFSRDDFEGTFPTSAKSKQTGLKQGKQAFEMSEAADLKQPWYNEEMPTQAATPGTSATNSIKLWHMKGRDYNDPLWDDLLNQLTIEEMANQIGNGFRGPREIQSIDKPTVWDTDGPLGRRESTDIQWAANPVLAQTFNRDLAYRQGVMFGNTIFTGPNGRGGTYGVGLDIHRSPFAGRYFEYYSEDGLVSGLLGAEVIEGSSSKGCYQVIKHLLLNDHETERNTVQTWTSEQALREIYGKGFELGVKKGGAMAMMTGVNSIGDIPCSLNYGLLTELVRGEWGFEGFIITDMYCEDTNISMRAGIDTMMAYPTPKNPETKASALTSTHVSSMRKAVKNIFFTMANSSGINGVGGDRLDRINYIGADSIYAVQNVDNEVSVATAEVKNDENAKLKYSLRQGSSLPSGMVLNADGSISGAPTQAGTYTFSILASEDTKAYYPYKDVAKIFRMTVYPQNRIPDKIIYEDDELGVIPYGFDFNKSIKSAVLFDKDGKLSTNISYTLAQGSQLPNGLKLENGVIVGKATAAPGTYFFTIVASAEGKESASLDFIVKVKAYSIQYEGQDLPNLVIGKKANLDIGTATSPDGVKIKYALKDGSKLPEGLSLLSTGFITGTPTRAYDDCTFTVLAQGELAPTQEVTYSLNVLGIVFEDVTYDKLLIGKEYSFNLAAKANNGSTSDIYYELKEGSTLPKGFSLLADGTLFGKGEGWGKQTFTVQAKSEGNVIVEANITLDIYSIFEAPVEDEPVVTPPTGCNSKINVMIGGISSVLILGIAALFIVKNKKRTDK